MVIQQRLVSFKVLLASLFIGMVREYFSATRDDVRGSRFTLGNAALSEASFAARLGLVDLVLLPPCGSGRHLRLFYVTLSGHHIASRPNFARASGADVFRPTVRRRAACRRFRLGGVFTACARGRPAN